MNMSLFNIAQESIKTELEELVNQLPDVDANESSLQSMAIMCDDISELSLDELEVAVNEVKKSKTK